MSSERNKIHIHFNNSTKVSLNDRFTAIQSTKINLKRNNPKISRSSEANRKLVQRLNIKHNRKAGSKIQKVKVSSEKLLLTFRIS